MARGLRSLSTEPVSDLNILFRGGVFACLIADGDMHLKNLALLKIAQADAKGLTSVRFAALYDAVITRVSPGLGRGRMALKPNSKDDRLTRQDFLALARTIGVSAGDAETAIADLTARVADRAQGLQLTAFAAEAQLTKTAQDKVIALVSECFTALAPEGG